MSTRAQILAEIAAQFPDNTTGLITPAKLRQVCEDLANSSSIPETDGITAADITDLPVDRRPLFTGTQAEARLAIGAAKRLSLRDVTSVAPSLWIDAAQLKATGEYAIGAKVPSAEDWSGLGNHFTNATELNQPTFNIIGGRPALYFSNVVATQNLSNAGISTNTRDFSWYVAGAVQNQNGASGILWATGNSPALLGSVSLNQPSEGWVAAAYPVAASGVLCGCGESVFGLRGTAEKLALSRNQVTAALSPLGAATVTGMKVGSYDASWGLIGWIREIVAFPRSLSDTDHDAVVSYLQNRHSVQAKSVSLLDCYGDSITAGVGSNVRKSYAHYIAEIMPEYDVSAFGISGNTLTNIAARMNKLADRSTAAAYKARKIVIFGGTNDIATGTSAATTYTRLEACIALAVAAGYGANDILIPYLLPRNGISEATRTEFNGLITDGTGYVKVGTPTSGMWAAGANASLHLYDSGQLHPNLAGSRVIAAELAKKL